MSYRQYYRFFSYRAFLNLNQSWANSYLRSNHVPLLPGYNLAGVLLALAERPSANDECGLQCDGAGTKTRASPVGLVPIEDAKRFECPVLITPLFHLQVLPGPACVIAERKKADMAEACRSGGTYFPSNCTINALPNCLVPSLSPHYPFRCQRTR